MDNEFTGFGQVLGQQGTSHVTAQGVLGEWVKKREKKVLIQISSLLPSFPPPFYLCAECSVQLRVIFQPVLV